MTHYTITREQEPHNWTVGSKTDDGQPERRMNLSDDQVTEFLRGVMTADGLMVIEVTSAKSPEPNPELLAIG